jgi:hypothetical protein
MPHSERPSADANRRRPVENGDLDLELARRRARALSALDERKRPRIWIPAVPVLAVLALWFVLGGLHRFRARATVIPLHGYEVVLTGPSSPGFYRRLRFYRWLAHEERRS